MNIQHKALLAVFISSIAIVWPFTATAGLKSSNQVRVIKHNGSANYDYAYGTLSAARVSSDDTQSIGCLLETAGVAGETQRLECYAKDVEGQSLSCVSHSANLIRVARALPGYGWMYFRRDAAGECIYLQIRLGSPYLP